MTAPWRPPRSDLTYFRIGGIFKNELLRNVVGFHDYQHYSGDAGEVTATDLTVRGPLPHLSIPDAVPTLAGNGGELLKSGRIA